MMRMQPKVSIITITYNSEKTLERTIRSIISQDYSQLEYIVVDGGSSDRTIEIIRKYENKITKWISEPDNGISDAFNKGIKMASGEIIGLINSDDGLLPNAITKLVEYYDPKVEVYRGKIKLIKEDTGTEAIEIPSMKFRIIKPYHVNHQGTFITKSAYNKYGMYDVRCRNAMDFDILLRMERQGAVFCFVDEILAFYTLGGITFDKYTRKRFKETMYILKKNDEPWHVRTLYGMKIIARETIKKFVSKERLMRLTNKPIDH